MNFGLEQTKDQTGTCNFDSILLRFVFFIENCDYILVEWSTNQKGDYLGSLKLENGIKVQKYMPKFVITVEKNKKNKKYQICLKHV